MRLALVSSPLANTVVVHVTPSVADWNRAGEVKREPEEGERPPTYPTVTQFETFVAESALIAATVTVAVFCVLVSAS